MRLDQKEIINNVVCISQNNFLYLYLNGEFIHNFKNAVLSNSKIKKEFVSPE